MKNETPTRRTLLQAMGASASMATLTGVGTARNSRTDRIAFAEVSYIASSMEPVAEEAEKVTVHNFPYHRVYGDYLYLNKRLLPIHLERKFDSHKGALWDGQYHKAPGRVTDRSAPMVNPSGNARTHAGFALSEGAEIPEFSATIKDDGAFTITGLGRQPVSIPAGDQRVIRLPKQTSSVLTKGESPNTSVEIIPKVTVSNYGVLKPRDIRNPAHME